MNATQQAGDWALAVCLTIATLFALLLTCLDRRTNHRRDRARKRCATTHRHPTTQPRRRLPATRCPTCQIPVAYEHHPQGRGDALALHTAYDCTGQPAVRRNPR